MHNGFVHKMKQKEKTKTELLDIYNARLAGLYSQMRFLKKSGKAYKRTVHFANFLEYRIKTL